MSKLKFTGFPFGTTATIEVTSPSRTDRTSVTDWGVNATLTVSVLRSILEVAPERLTFEVTGWKGFNTAAPGAGEDYDERLHNIIYVADFGDTDTVYQAPVKGFPEWKNRNTGFGPRVTHVYRKPGMYTVTIWAYELTSDRRAKWTGQYTVGDPDTEFSNSDTAYVSVASDFTNAPIGAGQYSSFAAAVAARTSAAKTRFMLKAGETHTSFADLQLPGGHVHVVNDYDRSNDADKGYVRPILEATAASGYVLRTRDFQNRDVVIQGLDFRGPWDTTTETGEPEKTGITVLATLPAPQTFIIDDCFFDGFKNGIHNPGHGTVDPSNSGLTVHDTVVTNWRDFGVYCGGASNIDLLGCRIAQDVDALSGGPKDGSHNNHGPVRLQTNTAQFVTVDGCDMFSRTGWVENTPNYFTQQPCFRFNQSGLAGSLLNMQRNACEGGFEIIKLSPANTTYFEGIQNIIIDKNVLLGSHMTAFGVTANLSGITMRNVLMFVPNVPRILGIFDPVALLRVSAPTNNSNAVDAPIELYHNTIVNLMSDDNTVGGDATMTIGDIFSGTFTITERNNLIDQKNLTLPDAVYAPLSDRSIWSAREKGYIGEDVPILESQRATAGGVPLGAPLLGSLALGAAFEEPALHFDIYGRRRPDPPSIGAMEYRRQD
ncbi:MAG: hypothetical protein AAF829_06805 [Pseudomonadota bacterium]